MNEHPMIQAWKNNEHFQNFLRQMHTDVYVALKNKVTPSEIQGAMAAFCDSAIKESVDFSIAKPTPVSQPYWPDGDDYIAPQPKPAPKRKLSRQYYKSESSGVCQSLHVIMDDPEAKKPLRVYKDSVGISELGHGFWEGCAKNWPPISLQEAAAIVGNKIYLSTKRLEKMAS
jgi:hypothetical protein